MSDSSSPVPWSQYIHRACHAVWTLNQPPLCHTQCTRQGPAPDTAVHASPGLILALHAARRAGTGHALHAPLPWDGPCVPAPACRDSLRGQSSPRARVQGQSGTGTTCSSGGWGPRMLHVACRVSPRSTGQIPGLHMPDQAHRPYFDTPVLLS